MLTCQIIYTEASSMLYSGNHLFIWYQDHGSLTALWNLLLSSVASIHHLTIHLKSSMSAPMNKEIYAVKGIGAQSCMIALKSMTSLLGHPPLGISPYYLSGFVWSATSICTSHHPNCTCLWFVMLKTSRQQRQSWSSCWIGGFLLLLAATFV